jgi:formylglycine-generating enzyme required for sulfatase activity
MQVEGGTFQMGSDSRSSGERPVQVTVQSFYMGIYEVIQKEWAAVMGSNPSKFRGPDLPVETVNWYDAVKYCNKRSKQEGLTPAYQGSRDSIRCNFRVNGYRLPTEAEWEYAAKGGTKQACCSISTAEATTWMRWGGTMETAGEVFMQ